MPLKQSGMAIVSAILFAPAYAAEPIGNPQDGADVFRNCQSCHKVGPNAKNGVGPTLNGVVGRAAGSLPDYAYSSALKSSGIIWDFEALAKYLHNPRAFMPRTKMAYPGLKSDQDIADVIEYLRQFDAKGAHLNECDRTVVVTQERRRDLTGGSRHALLL